MQRVRADAGAQAQLSRGRSPADKQLVQLATPDMPTVNPGDDAARALGTSDLPYRMEMSWDTTYNDVFLVDLKTGRPQKILEHWGSSGTTLSPGGKYLLYFDERDRPLVHATASPTASASTSPRSCP